MSASSDPEQESIPAFKPFTVSERIQQLNDIDKSIAQLLRLAHEAVQTLSTIKQSDSDLDVASSTDRREAFQSITGSYLDDLHSVDIRMKRQIWGLEEAGIIPDKLNGQYAAGSQGEGGPKGETPTVDKNMGKLDVGWLNSRSGKVERDMEAELWKKARTFLEEGEHSTTAVDGQAKDGDTSMELRE